jgi:hypothetical protein
MDKLIAMLALKLAEKTAPIVAEKLIAVLPIIAAAVAKAVVDEIVEKMPDFDIPGVSDVFDLTETVRAGLQGKLPDVDIPIISDVFDLTEFLNSLKPKGV